MISHDFSLSNNPVVLYLCSQEPTRNRSLVQDVNLPASNQIKVRPSVNVDVREKKAGSTLSRVCLASKLVDIP